MPDQLTFPISPDGLTLDVQIGLPAAELQARLALGQSFISVVTVRGLIDSGADATSVSPGILTRLGLRSAGQVHMTTASGSAIVNRYEVSLSILNPASPGGPALVRPLWYVTDFVQPLPRIEVLIGMDLIRQIMLTVNGPAGTFTMNC